MTVKDTWDTKGMVTTIGLHPLANNKPKQDATLVARLKNAGAIIWGKTSLPFGSYDWQCHHPLSGRCNNPWHPGHTPGGSSGGSAAVVAAGISPVELGSDVAGSIRWPAHCCGVYGLRATEGLLDGEGHANIPGSPPAMRHFAAYGPLARSAEDIGLLMDVMLGDATDTTPPKEPKSLSEAKVGWTQTIAGLVPSRQTQSALQQTLKALKEAGASVEEIEVPFDLHEAYEVYGLVHGFEYKHCLPVVARNLLVTSAMRWLYYPYKYGRGLFTYYTVRGLTASISTYFRALKRLDQLRDEWRRWFRSWDLWITPVALTPALAHQRPGKPVAVDGHPVAYCDVAGPYTCPTAALGHPVLSVPTRLSDNGLPIGLQFHAAPYNEKQLIAFASELATHTETFPHPSLPPKGT